METIRLKRPRRSEVIGGGFFVVRIGKRSGRIKPAALPFEHGSLEAATEEAKRRAALQPGEAFQVYAAVTPAHIFNEPEVQK